MVPFMAGGSTVSIMDRLLDGQRASSLTSSTWLFQPFISRLGDMSIMDIVTEFRPTKRSGNNWQLRGGMMGYKKVILNTHTRTDRFTPIFECIFVRGLSGSGGVFQILPDNLLQFNQCHPWDDMKLISLSYVTYVTIQSDIHSYDEATNRYHYVTTW